MLHGLCPGFCRQNSRPEVTDFARPGSSNLSGYVGREKWRWPRGKGVSGCVFGGVVSSVVAGGCSGWWRRDSFWGLWLIFLDCLLQNVIGLTGRLPLWEAKLRSDGGVRRDVEGLADHSGGRSSGSTYEHDVIIEVGRSTNARKSRLSSRLSISRLLLSEKQRPATERSASPDQ